MEGFAVFDPFFNAALFKKTCPKKVLHATQLMRRWDSSPLLFYVVLCGRSWRAKRTKLSPLHPNQKTDNFALRIWLSVDCVKAFTLYFGLPVDVEVRAGGEE